MRVTLFGCGSWGARIARRLVDEIGGDLRLTVVDDDMERAIALARELDCDWSCDPYGYLAVTGTQASSVERGKVIIATPPTERATLVHAAIHGYGLAPDQIRIEKPLAETIEDAEAIVRMCEQHGVQLTVGFTLLHHPLYEVAFRYATIYGGALSVSGTRWGRHPRHIVDPLLDVGIHAASIAAHLDTRLADLTVGFVEHADARRTTIHTRAGDVVVDELELCVRTPDGDVSVDAAHDALGCDLRAWLAGEHRGTPTVALAAQREIRDAQEGITCVA